MQSFRDNFGKYKLILIISFLNSEMNCRRSCTKICRLASNLLLHYPVKVECLTIAQLFIHIRQNNQHVSLLSDDNLVKGGALKQIKNKKIIRLNR